MLHRQHDNLLFLATHVHRVAAVLHHPRLLVEHAPEEDDANVRCAKRLGRPIRDRPLDHPGRLVLTQHVVIAETPLSSNTECSVYGT